MSQGNQFIHPYTQSLITKLDYIHTLLISYRYDDALWALKVTSWCIPPDLKKSQDLQKLSDASDSLYEKADTIKGQDEEQSRRMRRLFLETQSRSLIREWYEELYTTLHQAGYFESARATPWWDPSAGRKSGSKEHEPVAERISNRVT